MCHSFQDKGSLHTYPLGASLEATEPVSSVCPMLATFERLTCELSPAWLAVDLEHEGRYRKSLFYYFFQGNVRVRGKLFHGKMWYKHAEDYLKSQQNDESSCSWKRAGRCSLDVRDEIDWALKRHIHSHWCNQLHSTKSRILHLYSVFKATWGGGGEFGVILLPCLCQSCSTLARS